jgi:hypothetical protein
MENIIIDLKIRIQQLEQENNALKSKMTLIYSNWQYDYSRFNELKTKCKFGYCKDLSDNIVDDSERRDINIDKLRMV